MRTVLLLTLLISASGIFLMWNSGIYKPAGRSPERGEAYDALTFLTAMNAFPNADIPPDAYAKAWVHHRELLSKSDASLRSIWESIGPENIGGRTSGIAIDPNDTSVVWLGSASGGLWRSESGGLDDNWDYIATGFPVLGVSTIAINPSNTQELFIGTGETYAYGKATNGLVDRTQRGSVGIGILKTMDGGSTWTHSLDWSYNQGSGVWDIVYHPSNTEIVYAATTEGIYKTTDGGTTWSLSLDRKMVMDLIIDKVEPETLYAGVGNEDSDDKGIYKTTDGGSTWTVLTNGLPPNTHDGRITLAHFEGNHHVIMALIGNRYNTVGIYKSSDAGASWILKSSQEIVSYQGWYSKGLLIKADDETKVLSGGVVLFKSTTSGSNFSSFGSVHSDIHDIISNPKDPNKVYVVTDGGLYRCNSFTGNNWIDCSDGYVTSQHYIGSVSSQNPQLALSGLQDNSTIRYTGSVNWQSVIGGDGSYNAINPADDDTAYGSSQYLNVYRSKNSGASWVGIYSSPSDPNGDNPAAFLAPLTLSPSHTRTLYIGSQTLLKSTNAGNTWTKMQPDPVDNGNHLLSIAVSANHPDTVFFATTPTDNFPMHIYRSYDGGSTITDISAGLPNRYCRRITVNPYNAREIYAVFSGFSLATGGHIYKSLDAGTNWTDISTALPDLPFHCLAIDPNHNSNIYAGCDFTVYASSNGGADWFVYGDGFPDAAMVFDLVVSPSDFTLFAFTHGNGVYKNALLDEAVSSVAVDYSPEIKIFPNPASDQLNLDLRRFTRNVQVTLADASGKTCWVRNYASAREIRIPVSDYTQGIYFLKVEGEGLAMTRKVLLTGVSH